MHITLFISRTYGGGAERVVCNLANFLANQGHNVEILVVTQSDSSYFVDSRVKIVPLLENAKKKNKLFDVIRKCKSLRAYVRQRTEIDIYVVMLPLLIIILLALKHKTNAKMIISERADPVKYSVMEKILLRHYAKKADGFVFQTEEAKKWYESIIKNKHTIVIPNAINPDILKNLQPVQKQKQIISAGRLTKQKNFSLLITAFAQIHSDFPEYSLIIYGAGIEKKYLEKQIRRLGLSKKIILAGVSDCIANEFMRSALYVLSSDYEGMPNTLMEAMALGLPCIATDCPVGGSRFLIQNKQNGILVPCGNKKSLATAMREILSNEEFAHMLGENAKAVRQNLNADTIYSQWENFLITC